MSRYSRFGMFALVTGLLAACPPVETDPCAVSAAIGDFFPADNAVGSWVASNSPALTISNNKAEAEADVNGDADSFTAKGMVAFARKGYESDTTTAELRVWQLPDADTTKTVFDDIIVNDTLYSGLSWTDVSLGDAGRYSDTGANWWYIARFCAYQVEAKLPNDTANQAEAESLLKALIANIK